MLRPAQSLPVCGEYCPAAAQTILPRPPTTVRQNTTRRTTTPKKPHNDPSPPRTCRCGAAGSGLNLCANARHQLLRLFHTAAIAAAAAVCAAPSQSREVEEGLVHRQGLNHRAVLQQDAVHLQRWWCWWCCVLRQGGKEMSVVEETCVSSIAGTALCVHVPAYIQLHGRHH